MLSAKTKGLFVEKGHYSVLVARTSAPAAPFVIEELHEFSQLDGSERLRNFIADSAHSKASAKMAQAIVSVYPDSSFFRRHTVESPAKAKDPAYFTDLLENQFRIDPASSISTVLNAVDGSSFDPTRSISSQKELLICGASAAGLLQEQDTIVGWGIYPERLELGSISMLGGMVEYSRFAELSKPVLTLEIGHDHTHIFIISAERVDLCRSVPTGLNSMYPVIRNELGLKDEESAKKLLFSNTFDFTETAQSLLRKLLREVQASTGFYEVQTGQSIGHMLIDLLPKNLGWIRSTLSKSLGIPLLEIDFGEWLNSLGITASDQVQLGELDQRWFGLLSLMPNLNSQTAAAATDGKGQE